MKLKNVVVGQLKTPKGGVFNGRSIPKSQINNEFWLRVLELQEPPQDGLYVRRAEVSPAAGEKKKKKKGFLYRIAKAMVDYERNGKIQNKGSARSGAGSETGGSNIPPQPAPVPPRTTSVSSTPAPTSWLSLSPDIESELLGLEQLGPNEHITIVGAGITGLTLAWMLSRSRPDLRITIIDANTEVGGWMQSRVVDPGVLFESGPRTLLPSHPGSEIIARILYEIDARDALMGAVPNTAGVNAKALVHNGKIQYLPRNAWETLAFLGWGSLLRGGRLDALRDLWRPARSQKVNDESVADFVQRRLGKTIAERMVSAVMRGIYGADSRQLSARSVARLNRLFYLERTEQMSVLGAMLSGSLGYLESYSRDALPAAFDALVPPSTTENSNEARSLSGRSKKYSLYGFKNGIQGLAKTLANDLKPRNNIEFVLGTRATEVLRQGAREVIVKTSRGQEISSNMVVSTIADPKMFEKTAPEVSQELQSTKYSSLAVVNVWVPDETVAKEAFGVLVPKSEDKWNENGVLGIIFDSSVRKAMEPLDTPAGDSAATTDASNGGIGGSCLTVMLGGDLWQESLNADQWTQRALKTLLNLHILEPRHVAPGAKIVTQTKLQKNAIPLYEVGHSARQQRVHTQLSSQFGGRVALVGMAYGRGCGVSDCVVDSLTLALRFSPQRQLLYPQYFFDHWWQMTRPEYYA